MTQSNGDAACATDKIIKQIEYYFGDINLMKDKFLKEKIQEDDGWVTIDTMLKFNRLKQLTEEPTVICNALSKSELVEVSEDKTKIRRNPDKPLPGDSKERRDEITSRSIYAKVFPQDVSLDDLMTFFEKYGPVENIFMRRDFHKKSFKGSVFVLFSGKEDAEKFVKEEGTKYGESEEELIKKFKSDYYKDKADERKKKTGRKEEKKQEEVKEEPEDEEEKVKQQMTKNAVLHLNGMDPETTREDVKTFFQEFSQVGWVDFDKGVTEGYLRLREPGSAEPTVEKAKAAGDGKIIINDKELEVRVVEGEEELDYWKKMFKEISARHSKRKSSDYRQGGGRNFRGGRRNRGGPQGKKREHEKRNNSDEPSHKAAKVE